MMQRSFDELTAEARLRHIPILVYFAGRGAGGDRLDRLFATEPVSAVVARRFVFRIYERGRGTSEPVSRLHSV